MDLKEKEELEKYKHHIMGFTVSQMSTNFLFTTGT